MKHSFRTIYFAYALALSVPFILAGCDKYNQAVKMGEVSKELYDAVCDPVVDEIARLVHKSQDIGLTGREIGTLRQLNDFRPMLETYHKVHEQYVEGLKIWKLTQEKPASLITIATRIEQFVRDARKIKQELKGGD